MTRGKDFPNNFAFRPISRILAGMNSPLLDALLESPVMPEIIQEA
jgi:hypothetical protein